ncbi:MAG: hypothetical protein V3S30_03535 [Thermoanaerobaculia bacterium]
MRHNELRAGCVHQETQLNVACKGMGGAIYAIVRRTILLYDSDQEGLSVRRPGRLM